MFQRRGGPAAGRPQLGAHRRTSGAHHPARHGAGIPEPRPSAQDTGDPSPVLLTERWIAGRTAPGADAAFLARLSSLLSGEDGQAHLLNLVSSAEDITTLPEKSGLLAVLIEGGMVGDSAMPAEVLPKLTSEVVASAPKARWRAAVVPTVLTALILLLVGLALIAGNWT